MKINLHIEQLVLDGIELKGHQRTELQSALTSELVHLLGNGGLRSGFSAGVSLQRISTQDIQTDSENTAQFGKQIAHSIYGGIGFE